MGEVWPSAPSPCRRRTVAAVFAAVAVAACAAPAYQPQPVLALPLLPADAYARCRELLAARYGPLETDDAAAFRLRTDWVAGSEPDVASQVRAAVFADGEELCCVVEARYLRLGWFDTLPSWSTARPDAVAERELAAVLVAAMTALPPARPNASASLPSAR